MKQETVIKLKLILAIVVVIISLALGTYTKVMFVLQFHIPFYRWLNLSLYIISWILIFIAAFFVGKEVLALADLYIKKKMRETYDITVDIHKKGLKKGIETTKKIHKHTVHHGKKHLKKATETTKKLHKKTIHHGKKHVKKALKGVKKTIKI